MRTPCRVPRAPFEGLRPKAKRDEVEGRKCERREFFGEDERTLDRSRYSRQEAGKAMPKSYRCNVIGYAFVIDEVSY